ncbi:MAG TPA: LamG domain-containing protein [Conexibacter sp.]|nr:LamG domain-containing protein [Conexibacter sp.]
MDFRTEVLADSPSAYFRLGETSGTSAADAIGGAAGTYTGGFTIPTTGLLATDPDGAVTFNGSSGYVTAAHRAAFDLGDTFTLECLIKPTAYRDSGGLGGCMIDLGGNCPIFRFADSLDGRFILRKNGVSTLVTSTVALPLAVLSHVAITKSGSTVHQYASGVDVTGTVTNATMASNSLPFVIGAADGGGNNYFGGVVDEVIVYPTALSAARIQTHWLAAINRPPSPQLAGLAVQRAASF